MRRFRQNRFLALTSLSSGRSVRLTTGSRGESVRRSAGRTIADAGGFGRVIEDRSSVAGHGEAAGEARRHDRRQKPDARWRARPKPETP